VYEGSIARNRALDCAPVNDRAAYTVPNREQRRILLETV
jgi:hypothetical protein